MGFLDIMTKIRQLDHLFARWLLRHFYFLFFQLVLVGIFFFFLLLTFKTLDIAGTITTPYSIERLLFHQNLHTLVVILLLLLNSFWMLYMFNGLERIRSLLKDINFNLMRRRNPS
jgi:hypothetical protein